MDDMEEVKSDPEATKYMQPLFDPWLGSRSYELANSA